MQQNYYRYREDDSSYEPVGRHSRQTHSNGRHGTSGTGSQGNVGKHSGANRSGGSYDNTNDASGKRKGGISSRLGIAGDWILAVLEKFLWYLSGKRDPRAHRDVFGRWALVFVVLYMEILLKAFTTGGFFPSIIYIALFSFCFGRILYLLITLPFSAHARSIIATVILSLLPVMYGVPYFVFRQFGIFYDLNTMTGGAGQALTGFTGSIFRLIFSPEGIFFIVLVLLPLVLYRRLLLKRWGHVAYVENAAGRLRIVVQIVVAFVAALLIIAIPSTTRATYFNRYNFNTSVPTFGLANSMLREVLPDMGGSTSSFETVSVDIPVASEAASEAETEEEVVYEDSVLDIDFSALAESADNSTFQELDEYVASLTPSKQNKMTGYFEGKNLIFISAEAFSAEAIREDTTPTLYRMATKGMQFTDYYQPSGAGTTGGECNNLMGVLPTEGGSTMDLVATHYNYLTMGSALSRQGYNGWMFHNNSYTVYDRDVTHNALGYSNGFMGMGNGMEEYVSEVWPESDLEMVQGTFDNIYSTEEPFNVYYMSVSGHSEYTLDGNAMSVKNWDAVADLPYSDAVKCYLAANIELDKAMEYLIQRLEEEGIADDTVIVIAADHYPYGLEDGDYLSELYGYEVETGFQRDHNRLIIWSGCLEDEDPIVMDEPVSSLDILPTLLNLFGCDWDSRLLPGRDVFSDASPLVFLMSYDWKTDLGEYDATTDTFTPNDGVEVPDGYVDAINTIVSNKIKYCDAYINYDYLGHVFGVY